MKLSNELPKKMSYSKYEESIKFYAEEWFKSKKIQTTEFHSYIVKNSWKDNMIIEDVYYLIQKERMWRISQGLNFALHNHINNGKSSQAMLFNLVGSLVVNNDISPLISVLRNIGIIDLSGDVIFEYEDKHVFHEYGVSQPTSLDLVLKDRSNKMKIFIECKFTEKDFGNCENCKSELNPAINKDACYLHSKAKRTYWDLMDKYGFSEQIKDRSDCIFKKHYQFFREILFALEHGGVFVLLYDDRNPNFHKDKELMPLLERLIPEEHKDKFKKITVQELVAEIENSGNHIDWIDEFKKKYGL